MAQNPDPALELTSFKGVTRTIDDWATVFQLAIVILPPRPEASQWIPVIDRMYATLGDSDARTCVCVAGNKMMASKILGDAAERWLTFCDPDGGLALGLKLERLPAFVHLRQDTSLVDAAEGWSPSAWQRVADSVARSAKWTSPVLSHRTNPPASPGWPLSA